MAGFGQRLTGRQDAKGRFKADAWQGAAPAPAPPIAKPPTAWSGRTEAEIGAGYKKLAPATAPSDAEQEAVRKQKVATGTVITNADL